MADRVIKHRDFVRDLDRGAVGEDVIEEFFKKEYNVILKSVSDKNRYWDFEVVGLDETVSKYKKATKTKLLKKFKKNFGTTIEVKFDEAAEKYKRFFIELLFDVEKDVAGAIANCKSDLITWVVPQRKGRYKVYLFKRAELISWLIIYALESGSKMKLRTPGISPRARGIAIPITDITKAYGFLGEFNFKF